MRNFLKILTVALLVISCSKEKPKLELFSPESFAYELDNGWELNSSVRVKGLQQEKNKNGYSAKLSYTIDVITPAGDTLKNAYDGIDDVNQKEEISETAVDVQIEFDSTFAKGKYILLYSVHDDLDSQNASISDTVNVGQ